MLSDDDLGAIDVFTKPVDLDALLGLVARTCTRRSSC
jgi:DNA-binding NtrC family response regulator